MADAKTLRAWADELDAEGTITGMTSYELREAADKQDLLRAERELMRKALDRIGKAGSRALARQFAREALLDAAILQRNAQGWR